MARTITTVINDLIREVGDVDSACIGWKIPVERDGWACEISIGISDWRHVSGRNELSISVHAFGYMTGDDYKGLAHYLAFSGAASPARLTRRWIEQVLRREIETARLAALAFTEADIRPCDLSLDHDLDEYRESKKYFESTLK